MFERAHQMRCACSTLGTGPRPFALPGTVRVYERDRPFLVRHLDLDLTLHVVDKRVEGIAALTVERNAERATTVSFDAVAFDLRSVRLDGKMATYTYDGKAIHVDVASDWPGGVIEVAYEARPKRGLYFLEPDAHVRHRPRQVWSQCQEHDARHWFPCHDEPHVKMTTEVRVRVPRGWRALSNGDFVEEQADTATPGGPWARFHYRLMQPHPSYLVTVVAGEFACTESMAGDVKLSYWVPVGKEEDVSRTFEATPRMLAFFEELTGTRYPHKSYAQVVVSDFFFGGMENTTATTLYEHVLLDAKAAVDATSHDLIAHELAHQWFGNMVTCRDWSEAWLNEGFATYCEHLFREREKGTDEYAYGLARDLETYVAESAEYTRPVVCQEYEAPLELFDRHLYEKGSLILHAIRVELGDEVFFRGVRTYVSRHTGGLVETRDLMRIFEEVSGRSLSKHFHQWLYTAGHPQLAVEMAWDRGVLTVNVKQEQSSPECFDVDLGLHVAPSAGEAWRETLRVRTRQATFALRCPARPSYVAVDPDGALVGELRVRGPSDMLHVQARAGLTARMRWMAVRSLQPEGDPATLRVLDGIVGDEAAFWGTRAEAARALGAARSDEAFRCLERHVGVGHPKVRRAVVAALGAFRSERAASLLLRVATSDQSYLVEAEACRALGRTRQPAAFDVLLDALDRPSWSDVVRAAAAEGLAALRDERALPHLSARTRYGHAQRLRIRAAHGLAQLSDSREVRTLLEDLVDDRDPLVRLDAVRALREVDDLRSLPVLHERLQREDDPWVRRCLKEAVRELGEGRVGAVRTLRDEVERLRSELSELRNRHATLEARLPPGGAADLPLRKGGDVPAPSLTGKRRPPPPRARATALARLPRSKDQKGKARGKAPDRTKKKGA
jgi:aminopeptidase N